MHVLVINYYRVARVICEKEHFCIYKCCDLKHIFIGWLLYNKSKGSYLSYYICNLTDAEYELLKICSYVSFRFREVRECIRGVIDRKLSPREAVEKLKPYVAAYNL